MKKQIPTLEPLELDGVKLDLQYFFTKEYTEIGEAAIELPGVIEWLNCQLQANLEAKHKRKAALDRAEAEAYFRLKGGEFSRLGYGDKPTEAALERAVKLDEAVTQLNEDLAISIGWVERLSNLQRSLQGKLELVRSTEATRRALVA